MKETEDLAAHAAARLNGDQNLYEQVALRISELIGLRCQDVVLKTGAHVRCTGKGRKTRCVPLRKEVVAAFRHWFRERKGQPTDPAFPNARGQPLSRDGVEYILSQHVGTAETKCPSLKGKRVTAHVLRQNAGLRNMPGGTVPVANVPRTTPRA